MQEALQLERPINKKVGLTEGASYIKPISRNNFCKRFINNQFINYIMPALDACNNETDKLEVLINGATNVRGSRNGLLDSGLIQHHLTGTNKPNSNIAGVTIYLKLSQHTSIHNIAFTLLSKDDLIKNKFDEIYKKYKQAEDSVNSLIEKIEARGKVILDEVVPFIDSNKDYIQRTYKKCLDIALSKVLFDGKTDISSMTIDVVGGTDEKPTIKVSFPNAQSNKIVFPDELLLELIIADEIVKVWFEKSDNSGRYDTVRNQFGPIKTFLKTSDLTASIKNAPEEYAGEQSRIRTINGKKVIASSNESDPILVVALSEATPRTVNAYNALIEAIAKKLNPMIAYTAKSLDSDETVQLINILASKFKFLDKYDLFNAVDYLKNPNKQYGASSFDFESDVLDKIDELNNSKEFFESYSSGGSWYLRDYCFDCDNYHGDCDYDLELEEREEGVPPGTFTKAKMCPYFDSRLSDDY